MIGYFVTDTTGSGLFHRFEYKTLKSVLKWGKHYLFWHNLRNKNKPADLEVYFVDEGYKVYSAKPDFIITK